MGKKMKAALMGGSLCGLLGPALGAFLLRVSELAHAHAGITQFSLMVLDLLFFGWPLAVVFVGPGAFVLGAIGTLIIEGLSARVVTRKALVVQAVALGLGFGSIIPVVSETVWLGWKNIKFSMDSLIFGAAIGAVCAAVTLCLLQRRGLLRFQQSQASEGLPLA
jgi:cation transport ATPase